MNCGGVATNLKFHEETNMRADEVKLVFKNSYSNL